MSRCIVLMAAIALSLPALAEEVKNAPAPVVKVTPKAAPAAPAPAAKAAPAPAAPATAPAAPAAKAALAVTNAPTSQPTAAPGAMVPTDVGTAIDTSKTLWDAIKAKRWWFAVALGIYILLFGLGAFGLFKVIGTFWAWVLVAGLSVAAGCFAAFGEKGFSWSTFLGYVTAGPTIAYLRDFGKDVVLAWWKARKEKAA